MTKDERRLIRLLLRLGSYEAVCAYEQRLLMRRLGGNPNE